MNGLLDNDLSDHASTLVGLAVHAIGAGGGQLDRVLLAGGIEQVGAGDGVGVDSGLVVHGVECGWMSCHCAPGITVCIAHLTGIIGQ